MASLLPAAVVTVEAGDVDRSVQLAPDEEQLIAGAGERRRREFEIGRACARKALGRLGMNEVAILIGPQREPIWPAGIVASLTHCKGYCAAAAALAADVSGLGIDAELLAPLPHRVIDMVCRESERRQAEQLP